MTRHPRTTTFAGVALALGALFVGQPPAAWADAKLADWLSRAAGHIADIHNAEGAFSTLWTNTPRDPAALDKACGQLRDANVALQESMPTPDPKLTVDVQQAFDNFDSASEMCSVAITSDDDYVIEEFESYFDEAEQHLGSADSILFALSSQR